MGPVFPAAAARALAAARVPIVIAGGGPTGMAVALGLAQKGLPSIVVERFGQTARRATIANLAPAVTDEFAHLGVHDVVKRCQVLAGVHVDDSIMGINHFSKEKGALLVPDASRATGDVSHLLDAINDVDARPWGRVQFKDIENAMRHQAAEGSYVAGGGLQHYRQLIDIRYDTAIDGFAQDLTGVVLNTRNEAGAADAIRGSYLVQATGTRGLPGSPIKPVQSGAQMHFVGALFPQGGPVVTTRARHLVDGRAETTVGMASREHTLVWAQIPEDGRATKPEVLRAILDSRAPLVGVVMPLPLSTPVWPVTMQLGMSSKAVDGRVLGVGDAIRAPYFLTSTGLATGVTVDARAAVDALVDVAKGADYVSTFAAYEQKVLSATRQVDELSRGAMARHLDPTPPRP